MKSNHWTVLAGLSLLVPVLFWWHFAQEAPSAFYPFPALMFIPALFGLRQGAVAVPVAFFFVWNVGLFDGSTAVPKRSSVLLSVATVLSALWFVVGWKDGLAMQGAKYNYSVFAVNIVWIAALWILLAHCRKKEPSFKWSLLFHLMLFGWLAWYAFPFFGELP